jgi:hypothetical protein
MPGAGRDANRVAALRSSGASGPIEPGRAAEDVKEPDTPDAGWHRGGRPCKRAAGHIRGDGAYFPRVTGAARHTGDPRTARHFTVIARGCYCSPLALPATGIALHSHCAGRGERGRAGRDAQCHTTPCHTTPCHTTPRHTTPLGVPICTMPAWEPPGPHTPTQRVGVMLCVPDAIAR